jgi:TonB-linked SusC/RagA family outer membrane protein
MKFILLRQLISVPKFLMRALLIPVFFIGLINANAAGSKKVGTIDQVRIDLMISNATIPEIFDLIESKTEYTFVYDDRIIDKDLKISIEKNNARIYDILYEISGKSDLKFMQINEIINVGRKSWNEKAKVEIGSAQPQPTRITGKISSADTNEPLPGVNVVIKSTSAGTITDLDGNYQIEVPEHAVLVFSFIGYQKQEVIVGNQQIINISMEPDITSINEVIVVGAAIRERDLTGATVNVSEETLQERPVTSINEALQGRAAGVYIQNNPQPGGQATIKIRGNNSMQYGANPIYVVDGIVMDSDFNLINLDDVASINVLKDASSTALYGSRGANGVVVITTKKGTSGTGRITYDGWFGVQQFTNESITLGAKDMYDLRIDALENSATVGGAYYAQHPGATRQDFINDELLAEGKLWIADYEKESYQNGKSYDWVKEISRTAWQQNHNLSFSGGSDKGTYYMSFGYTDQQGLIQNSNYKKYSGRINAEQFLKPWLKIGTSTSYTRSAEELVDDKVFSVARAANPLLPIDDEYLYLAWGNNWDINMENPLKTLTIDRDRLKSRILSTNYLRITPVEGLNIRTAFSIDVVDQEYYDYIPSNIQQAYRDSYRGKAVHNFDHTFNYQWDNSVTYDKTVDRHVFSGLLSMSISKDRFKYTNVSARDFPIDDFSYYNLGAAFDKENFTLGSNVTTSTLMSFVGRANYEYDGKYMATVTARYDGSSRFAEGHKWGLFPSVALAWNMANENFMKNMGVFDLAKLRFGYGSVGNQAIPDYSFYSLYNPAYSYGSVYFNSTGVRGTRNLKWESQKQLNIGLDLGFFDNRLQATAEYFHIVNSNLLMMRSLSPLSGYSQTIENIGEMTNNGVELTVNARIIDKKDFKWDASFNISADKNEITKLYEDVNAIYSYGGYTGTDIQREGNFFLGESLNTIYMLEFDRIIQEEDMDYVNSLSLPGKTLQPGDILPKDQQAEGEEGHGVIDENDRVIIGKKDPKFYGGLSSKVAWKGLSLNAVFTYSSGAKAVSGYYEGLMSGTGYGAAHKDMLDRWTPTHTNTNIPRATYDNSIRFSSGETSWGIQNASFLRLATLTLAYDFPKTLAKKAGMENLRVYTTGNNVFLLSDYKGYDPENGDNYPTARMFVFGINFSF